ncbi:MAG: carboxypeptidase regulatory-like domain-containing protein [bacterium]|nr:carboxypeptidase regulatory-like domain-containing protein [bacterium]
MKTLITLAMGIVFCFGISVAQSDTGSLCGTVYKGDGSALQGVAVTLTSPDFASKSDVSNESGKFYFNAIPHGTYQLTFELEGFKTVVRKNITASRGRTTTIELTMEPSEIKEDTHSE